MGQSQSKGESGELPMEKPRDLPHNFQAIMQEADSPIDAASHDLHQRLHAGLLLDHKKKKYWVDEISGHNCFMLLARGLSITWGEDQRYWSWRRLKETSGGLEVEVADLMNVCWLEVHGKLETSKLTPGTTYEVAFIVMIKSESYGWNVPVNLKLVGPDGQVQEHKERLQDMPREQWMELRLGDFAVSRDKNGEIQFSMFEYDGGEWKRGLIIKGAIVRPKKSSG